MPVGLTSSVTVRAMASVVPVLNSVTWPLSWMRWPALTVGAVLVKTKMPSDVSGLPSPTGSCRKKPLLVSLVTTPVVTTVCPANGLVCPLPWMLAIGVMPAMVTTKLHVAVWASLLAH